MSFVGLEMYVKFDIYFMKYQFSILFSSERLKFELKTRFFFGTCPIVYVSAEKFTLLKLDSLNFI